MMKMADSPIKNNAEINQHTTTRYFWVGFSFFICVIISLVTISAIVSDKINAEQAVPVSQLNISGDMPYTRTSEIKGALSAINLSNFFHVNVNDVHKVIMELPWVYSVAVRKQWPNELKIHVIDQTPVASWNDDFLINERGNAFQADKSRITTAIPAFYGPEGSENVALSNYVNMNRLLGFQHFNIEELMLSERFAWELTLNNGVILNLGRENRIERVQRFMDIYPHIIENAKDKQQVNYVDLRYDTGVAVGWKQPKHLIKDNRA